MKKINVKIDIENHGLFIDGKFLRIRTFKEELEEFLKKYSEAHLRSIAEEIDKHKYDPYSDVDRMRKAIKEKINY